jgi:hypothetical protein
MMGLYDELAKLEERSPTPVGSVKPSRKEKNITSTTTRKSTRSSGRSRDNLREKSRGLPSRDEIQEFSFRLRDTLKVKVQAEVPHQWQGELEEIARQLKVKKLELYRFILGEFLGKVKRRGGE